MFCSAMFRQTFERGLVSISSMLHCFKICLDKHGQVYTKVNRFKINLADFSLFQDCDAHCKLRSISSTCPAFKQLELYSTHRVYTRLNETNIILISTFQGDSSVVEIIEQVLTRKNTNIKL